MPLFVGEFAGCPNGGEWDGCIMEVDMVTNILNGHVGAGWSVWEYEKFDLPTMPPQKASEPGRFAMMRAFARTYLQATQGVITGLDYDNSKGKFVAHFKANTDIAQPSELFASKYYVYPNGYNFELLDPTTGQLLVEGKDFKFMEQSDTHTKFLITNSVFNGLPLVLTVTAKAALSEFTS